MRQRRQARLLASPLVLCPAAYLKMDNVLIDDRRIHVDFSQSVSKLQAEWRRTRLRAPGLKRAIPQT